MHKVGGQWTWDTWKSPLTGFWLFWRLLSLCHLVLKESGFLPVGHSSQRRLAISEEPWSDHCICILEWRRRTELREGPGFPSAPEPLSNVGFCYQAQSSSVWRVGGGGLGSVLNGLFLSSEAGFYTVAQLLPHLSPPSNRICRCEPPHLPCVCFSFSQS